MVRDCQIIKKWDDHIPGENSHLAEQTSPQFQTTALFVYLCLQIEFLWLNTMTIPYQLKITP